MSPAPNQHAAPKQSRKRQSTQGHTPKSSGQIKRQRANPTPDLSANVASESNQGEEADYICTCGKSYNDDEPNIVWVNCCNTSCQQKWLHLTCAGLDQALKDDWVCAGCRSPYAGNGPPSKTQNHTPFQARSQKELEYVAGRDETSTPATLGPDLTLRPHLEMVQEKKGVPFRWSFYEDVTELDRTPQKRKTKSLYRKMASGEDAPEGSVNEDKATAVSTTARTKHTASGPGKIGTSADEERDQGQAESSSATLHTRPAKRRKTTLSTLKSMSQTGNARPGKEREELVTFRAEADTSKTLEDNLHRKPKESWAYIVFETIQLNTFSTRSTMTLPEIYEAIAERYPYFKDHHAVLKSGVRNALIAKQSKHSAFYQRQRDGVQDFGIRMGWYQDALLRKIVEIEGHHHGIPTFKANPSTTSDEEAMASHGMEEQQEARKADVSVVTTTLDTDIIMQDDSEAVMQEEEEETEDNNAAEDDNESAQLSSTVEEEPSVQELDDMAAQQLQEEAAANGDNMTQIRLAATSSPDDDAQSYHSADEGVLATVPGDPQLPRPNNAGRGFWGRIYFGIGSNGGQ